MSIPKVKMHIYPLDGDRELNNNFFKEKWDLTFSTLSLSETLTDFVKTGYIGFILEKNDLQIYVLGV